MNTDTSAPKEFTTVCRDGLPPIRFRSAAFWAADNRDHNSTRWTNVRIYRTIGGKYVAAVERMTCWQGEKDRYEAKACATAQEVIDYLRGDEDHLGGVSQEAVERAVKDDPAFAAVWVETVD